MARPKAFEREAALESAKMIFWRQGYSATTTDDLRIAMGIGRQSFYDTFVSKHRLFVEVLENYVSFRSARLSKIVHEDQSPLKTLSAILMDIADEDSETRSRGCLGLSSVCEFGTSDEAIQNVNDHGGAIWQKTFERLLKDAKVEGEVRASCDERATAMYLQTVVSGMRMTARAGMKPKELRQIAQVAIDGLKKHRG